MRKSRLVCIEIIDSTDVFVHIPHMENATCRTRVHLLANRNPFLNWQQYSRLAKVFLWSQVSIWVQKFCQELHYSESSPSSSTLSTNWFVDYFDCLWCECFSCIPFWSCLHFFDRSLNLESDFWSFTFCRLLPRWGQVSCLKNQELPFCWHSNYTWGLFYIIGVFFGNSFYALLCRRLVCTTLLKVQF